MPVCPTCRTPSEEGVLICPVDGTQLAQGGGLVGQIIAERYRVLARIGEGGMGTVYLCEHVALGKRMAVKVLRPEFSRDEELVRRFQHEARAASQIGQENIVDVFDFGHAADGSAYFVMEALEGESLARLLHREPHVPLPRALPILMQICRALGAAHQRGIVHRDLKPENVFLARREDGSEVVKVLDFGISKSALSSGGKRLTRAGSIIGTPEYMSPEQAAANSVDHRSDIYAFGVVAYETSTGRLPFQGETPLATLLKHQSEAPLPPRRLRPELPVELETLILRALVKRPEGRQQSMAEVAADLSRAMMAIDLEPVHTPVFGTALAPLMTNQGTARFRPRPASRGGTMALPDTDPGDTDTGMPRVTPPEALATPYLPGRVDTGREVAAVRRRRAQSLVGAMVGILALVLLTAVVARLASRRGEGERAAAPATQADAPATAAPAPAPAAPAPAPAALPAQAAAPIAPPEDRAEPAPPSREPKRRPSRPPQARQRGVGSQGKSGENPAPVNDILDPYR